MIFEFQGGRWHCGLDVFFFRRRLRQNSESGNSMLLKFSRLMANPLIRLRITSLSFFQQTLGPRLLARRPHSDLLLRIRTMLLVCLMRMRMASFIWTTLPWSTCFIHLFILIVTSSPLTMPLDCGPSCTVSATWPFFLTSLLRILQLAVSWISAPEMLNFVAVEATYLH